MWKKVLSDFLHHADIKSLNSAKSLNNLIPVVTPCVYLTCQVEFVLRELSFFIPLPQSRFIGCSGDFSVLKRTVLLFNHYLGGRCRKLAGTTTLAFRIVINCTTAESVLELVLKKFLKKSKKQH